MSDVRCRDLDIVHALPAHRSRLTRVVLSSVRWAILIAVVVVLARQSYVLLHEGLVPPVGGS